jgi:hypothetical protein
MKTLPGSLAFVSILLSAGWLRAQAEDPRPRPRVETDQAQHEHGVSSDSGPRRSESRSGRPSADAMQRMQAEMQASEAQVDGLLAEMNAATGDKKIEAMAALLNRLVQERRAMQRRAAGIQLQMMREMRDSRAHEAAGPSPDPAAGETSERFSIERAVAERQSRAEQAVNEVRRDAERAVNEGRHEAERAVAEAREVAAKAAAERDVARQQAEQAIAEARAIADKVAAARQDAERAIAEARKQGEQASAARDQAVREAERAKAAEGEAVAERAAAERARREAQKKSDAESGKRP